MFQCLRVDLVIHLGQLCALRCRQLPLRAIKGAGVVLHTQEIILFDRQQVDRHLHITGNIEDNVYTLSLIHI